MDWSVLQKQGWLRGLYEQEQGSKAGHERKYENLAWKKPVDTTRGGGFLESNQNYLILVLVLQLKISKYVSQSVSLWVTESMSE